MTLLKFCSLALLIVGCGSAVKGEEEVETAVLNTEVTAEPRETGSDGFSENDEELNQPGTALPTSSSANSPIVSENFYLASPSRNLSNVEMIRFELTDLVNGDTIRLYSDSSCEELLSTTIAEADTVSIEHEVTDEGSYRFYARKVNASGLGPCSKDGVPYTLDTTISNITDINLSNPASSPSNNPTPTLMVLGVAAGDRIDLFLDDSCSESIGNIIADDGGSTEITLPSSALISDSSFQIYGRVSDSAGNFTSCSLAHANYTLDQTNPIEPSAISLTSDPSPSVVATPSFTISGVETGATVRLFDNDSCVGPAIGSAVASGSSVSVTIGTLPSFGDYSIYARQTDLAGNLSNCSTATISYSYIDDPQPPNSGLVHWIAADSVTTDGSGNISAVNDKSNQTFGLQQTTPAYQPKLTNTGPGGLAMIELDGENDRLVGTGSSFDVKYILAAYRISSSTQSTSDLGQIWGQYHSVGHLACDARLANDRSFSFDGGSGGTTTGKYWLDDEVSFSTGSFGTTPSLLWEYDEIEVTAVEFNGVYSMSIITMGHLGGSFGITEHHFGGEIGEVLVYDASATTATINDARDYLKNKWLP